MFVEISTELRIGGATIEEKRKLKEALSFINPLWAEAVRYGRRTYGIQKVIKQYRCENRDIFIPRGYLYQLINFFGMPEQLINNTVSLDKVSIPSNIILRPLQAPWVEEMLRHNQGICVAPAGSGKTVMGLYAISQIGQPTLWITDQLNLVNQFIERTKTFLDVGTIGIIGGGKETIGDIVTVATVQTLSKRDLTEVSKKFGLVILDEAHICPQDTTLGVISQFAPKYLYGLTATPYREDNLEVMMHNAIGPTVAYMDRDEVIEAGGILPASVQICDTGVTFNKWGKIEYNDVIDFLIDNKKRNVQIVLDILSEIASGNICIALTSRIEHGRTLRDMLMDLGVDCEHIHSDTKTQTKKVQTAKLDRFTNGEVPLIIATYKLLSKGFDHQPTSRIFFCLPHKAKGLIEQAKGRIERTTDGKEDAIIYDYVDDIGMLKKQFILRMQQYKEHNLKITRT